MRTENITITRTIDREILKSIVITALEGGSNYWYYISDEAIETIKSVVPNYRNLPLGVSLFDAVFDYGVVIPIHDYENIEDQIGKLDAKEIQSRLQSLADNEIYAWALNNELTEDGDAGSSDVVFQYMCLGEVVYS